MRNHHHNTAQAPSARNARRNSASGAPSIRLGLGDSYSDESLPPSAIARSLLLKEVQEIDPSIYRDAVSRVDQWSQRHQDFVAYFTNECLARFVRRVQPLVGAARPSPRLRKNALRVNAIYKRHVTHFLVKHGQDEAADLHGEMVAWAVKHHLGDDQHIEMASMAFRYGFVTLARRDGRRADDPIVRFMEVCCLPPRGDLDYFLAPMPTTFEAPPFQSYDPFSETKAEFERRQADYRQLVDEQLRQAESGDERPGEQPVPSVSLNHLRWFALFQLRRAEVKDIASAEGITERAVDKALVGVSDLTEIPRRLPTRRGRPKKRRAATTIAKKQNPHLAGSVAPQFVVSGRHPA